MVMLIDEYRTSVVCSACDANTRQFRDRPGSVQVCREHTKRRIRRIRERAEDDGHRNNARRQLWCVDDDGHNLWPTSTCNDRQNAAGSQLSVYPLKFCDHCPVPTLWDRDNNAARNIGRIFMQYVQTGNLRSRPPSMRRPAGENVLDDAHDDEFEEEEEDEEEQALAPVME
ncbi:hypothetical protein BDB00DRAFT_447619 [Zychaea mexicana]|uniref:uncharacterized protein n=1 Tax=Zychaea mexicana TaxID=64656 RepID=UPI0022FDF323|nr:uncharacterized protein BDB00DRAFT_447619 [Zychaea mexicana]KAI9498419.1 hypothetical protein BDB00DRAFT_447619 [Zychaea mexicana]